MRSIVNFILFTASALIFEIGYTQNPSAENPKPNFLLILTDDQGYHDVSYYGTEDIRTPHIDSIIETGMRLDNFYANSPVCSPTRAAMLTGKYQDYVGVPGVIRTHPHNSWGYLSNHVRLLPEILQQNGYHTALIGKWHLGLESPNTPNERGFDHFHGWLGDMVDDYWEHRRHGINYMRLNEKVIDTQGEHASDLLTEWAVDYIHSRSQHGQPYFLFLSLLAPHFPVQPPEEWLNRVQEREPHLSETRANLIAFIEHMDDGIGQVIDALKETGAYENTVILFTSDNGGNLPDEANVGPYRDGKQSVYEGGLRVPTGVSWPAKIEAESNSDRILLTMDIFPTFLEAGGIPYDEPLNGVSFLPTLMGEDQGKYRDEPLFFTRREGGMRYGGLTIQAVRLGDWKLLQNSPFEPRELYNLEVDPYEENNVANEYPEKVQKLNALMMKHLQSGGAVPWQRPEHR